MNKLTKLVIFIISLVVSFNLGYLIVSLIPNYMGFFIAIIVSYAMGKLIEAILR